MDYIGYIKALHIIFVVTWFAGLFYIVRLFIYYRESFDLPQPNKQILTSQFAIMQKRLWYGITWPSAILTIFFGVWTVISYNKLASTWWLQTFMLVKYTLVIGLLVYHGWCQHVMNIIKSGNLKYSPTFLRIMNEVATVFLVAIIFVIVLKDALSWVFGLLGIVVFSILLLLAIRIYKYVRKDGN